MTVQSFKGALSLPPVYQQELGTALRTNCPVLQMWLMRMMDNEEPPKEQNQGLWGTVDQKTEGGQMG